MSFSSYRESIIGVKKLADNFTGLNKSDVLELNKLIEECMKHQNKIVGEFSSLIDEVKDKLTLLMDPLDQIKKELEKISGPTGTHSDILNMEPAWQQTNTLRNTIRTLLEQTAENIIGPREEIAAATEPSPLSKKPAQNTSKPLPPRTIKKAGPENKPVTPKLTPLVLNKNIGNEKKLLEEISKNIEMIKKNKKNP